MKNIPKAVLIVVLIIGVLFFGERVYNYINGVLTENQRLHTELLDQKEDYEQLSEKAAKLEILYKNQEKLKEELNKQFEKEKDVLKGRLKVLSNATFLIREKARKTGNSDLVYKGEKTKYVVNELRFEDGPPLGYILIFDDGRVVSKVYNHEIIVKNAISRDEDSGKYTIVAKADYVLKSPSINFNGEENWYGKPYALDISGGSATVDPTEKNQLVPKFQWWAPHINGGIGVGGDVMGPFARPTLNVSFSGFGKTKNDLDWKFLHLGLDIDTEFKYPGVHFMPFSYRFWPGVLKNTYIGPGVGWTVRGWNGQVNLSVGF